MLKELILSNLFVSLNLSTSHTTFQSMRSLLISAYKFSKAGKVLKELILSNLFVRLNLSTNHTTFQTMCSLLISAYKFSKAGKVKQLRLGNWREKRSVVVKLNMIRCATICEPLRIALII